MINYINVKRKQQSDDTLPSCSLSPQVGGFDSFGALPIECEPYMLDLLRFREYIGRRVLYKRRQLTIDHRYYYWLDGVLRHREIHPFQSHDRILAFFRFD